MEKFLTSFFQRVAKKDEKELNQLKKSAYFSFEPDKWHFTLPKLFSYLQENNYIDQNLDYRQFRQLLYGSSINKNIKFQDAEIIIGVNKSSVDNTEYIFIWK